MKIKKCCAGACLYALLLFGGRIGEDMRFVTASGVLGNFICELYKKTSSGGCFFEKHGGSYEFSAGKTETDTLFDGFLRKTPLRIDASVIKSDCCKKTFMRGAFLASGFVSEPEKPYHLEIKTSHHIAAEDFVKTASEYEITFKTLMRGGRTVLYLKSSEQIKDFLTLIGAQKYTFEYTNAELEKSLRNDINRALNCEYANDDKRMGAAEKQIGDIMILKEDGYPGVPDKLEELAELRLLNPEIGLAELGQLLDPPLSKAGVSHRMKKIAELAAERRK